MRIVTIPGANLAPELARRYDVTICPGKIVVDGVEHELKDGVPLAQVDLWVRAAKKHPYVLGTSAAEFIPIFRELGQQSTDILALMPGKKMIGTYDAARAAAATLAGMRDQSLNIEVIDANTTDVGLALTVIFAAEAYRAGHSFREVVRLVQKFTTVGELRFVVEKLDYLIKGGRATFLHGWVANFLNLRPVLGLKDGNLTSVDKAKGREDSVDKIVELLVDAVGAGRRVWAAVSHGNDPAQAQVLERKLRERF